MLNKTIAFFLPNLSSLRAETLINFSLFYPIPMIMFSKEQILCC